MEYLNCPKCGSTNVQRQAAYAALMQNGLPAQGHVVPNECREERCHHKWFDEE